MVLNFSHVSLTLNNPFIVKLDFKYKFLIATLLYALLRLLLWIIMPSTESLRGFPLYISAWALIRIKPKSFRLSLSTLGTDI